MLVSTCIRHVLVATVLALLLSAGRSTQTTAAFGDTRTLTFFNIHTKETTSVLYKKDGKIVPGAFEKLNWALRDWRANEKTSMDPELFDLLWEIYTELGSKEPIHIISAYRSRGTNNMLRATVGGQASESRHILGKAIDVHFPDVDLKRLRYSALIRERGGVGYYPTSALPFVHIDTDRVRHWPRLPRHELALLFPNGSTQHQPADGGPITYDDAKAARLKFRDLALQLASYHEFRKQPKLPTAMADAAALTPKERAVAMRRGDSQLAVAAATPPKLLEVPRVIDRPTRLTGPSPEDRMKLAELTKLTAGTDGPRLLAAPQLAVSPKKNAATSQSSREIVAQQESSTPVASLAPMGSPPMVSATAMLSHAGFNTGFAYAPAFDEEHPDELSYRPFPIAPLLTQTASADDPVLAQMQHPDLARTLELLHQAGAMPPMRLRPTSQFAAMMLSQQFKGEAVSIGTWHDQDPLDATEIQSRRVATTR